MALRMSPPAAVPSVPITPGCSVSPSCAHMKFMRSAIEFSASGLKRNCIECSTQPRQRAFRVRAVEPVELPEKRGGGRGMAWQRPHQFTLSSATLVQDRGT